MADGAQRGNATRWTGTNEREKREKGEGRREKGEGREGGRREGGREKRVEGREQGSKGARERRKREGRLEGGRYRPLANGGTNKASNLQVPCKASRRDKCSDEQESGEYMKIIDS